MTAGPAACAASTFDVAAAAGWYSAVAGLLAGFAFVAVLLPLDHEGDAESDQQTSHAVVVFICAFFSLVVLALMYAVLSGRTGEAAIPVAAHEQMLLGASFGLSVLLLMFGLRAVLGAYGRNRHVFDSARSLVLAVISLWGPLAVLALQFSNALDVQAQRGTAPACGTTDVGTWIDLAVTVAAGLGVVLLAILSDRLPRRSSAPAVAGKAVLGATFAIVAWTSVVVPLLPTDVVASAALEHLTLTVTAVLVVGFSAASRLGR